MSDEGSVVVNWLETLQLDADYSQSFIDNGYDDLDVCRQIGPADLDAIGVTSDADRDALLDAVAQLTSGWVGNRRSEVGEVTPVYFTLENPDSSVRKGRELAEIVTERLSDDALSLTDLPFANQVFTTVVIQYNK